MRKVSIRLFAMSAVVSSLAFGETYVGTGKIVESDPSSSFFTGYSDYVLSDGTFCWQNDSADAAIDKAVSLTNKCFTFDVPAGRTLTLAGPLSVPSGGLMATGGGTVKLTGGATIKSTWAVGSDGMQLAWDADGRLTSGLAGTVTAAGGDVLFDGGIYASRGMAYVGPNDSKSSSLSVVNGAEVSFGGAMNLGWGGSRTAENEGSVQRVYVGPSSLLTVNQLQMMFSYVQADRFSDCRITVDGGVLTNVLGSTRLAIHRSNFELTVTNGGQYVSQGLHYDKGLQIASGRQVITGVVNVVGTGSLLTANSLVMNTSAGATNTITIADGGTIALNRGWSNTDAGKGVVRFNDGTLTTMKNETLDLGTETPHHPVADWFTGLSGVRVGPLGMTLSAGNYAYLAVPLVKDDAASAVTPTTTVSGGGTVAMDVLPDDVAMAVGGGSTLKLVGASDGTEKSVSVADGGKVRLVASGGGNGLTLAGGNVALDVVPETAMTMTDWTLTTNILDTANIHADGTLHLTLAADYQTPAERSQLYVGGVWRSQKVDLTKDFRFRFKYFNGRANAEVAGGFAVVVQNAGDGLKTLGTSGNGCGYVGVENSFTFVLRSHHRKTGFGYNGVVDDDSLEGFKPGTRFLVPEEKPVFVELAYDATQKTVRTTVVNPFGNNVLTETIDRTVTCDLAAQCGADTAYIGVTAACDGGSPVSHCVSGAVFDDGSTSSAESVIAGASLAIGSGTGTVSLAVSDAAATARRTVALDRLTFSDGATITAGGTNLTVGAGLETTVDFASLDGSGTLNKGGSALLGIRDDGVKDLALNLNAGGLRLAKSALAMTVSKDDGDWAYFGKNKSGADIAAHTAYTGHAGVYVGSADANTSACTAKKTPIKIDGDWMLTADVSISGNGAWGWSLFFHRDARGYAAKSDYAGNSNLGYAGNNAVQKSFGIGFVNYKNNVGQWKYGTNGSWTSTVTADPVIYFNTIDPNTGAQSERTFKLTLVRSAAAKTVKLTLVQKQGGEDVTYAYTIPDIDLETLCGDKTAYLAFAHDSGGRTTAVDVDNLKIVYSEPAVASRQLLSVNQMAASAKVVLDATPNASRYRLADSLTAAAGTRLQVASASALPADLQLGALSLAGDFALAGDGHVTVGIDSLTLAGQARTLSVSGTVLSLPGSVSQPDGLKLALTDGAQVAVAEGVRAQIKSVTVNGVKVKPGTYTAATADWVVGAGSVSVGSGSVFVIK